MADKPFLEVRGVSCSFGKERVLEQIEFDLASNRVLAILGRSGSGKTTLLKILAGLQAAQGGQVWIGGEKIDGLPPHQRQVVYIYQEPLLFPHLSAFENIAFGLRVQKRPEAEVQKQVGALLEDLELADQGDKMPHQLSGGQRQRVAFGRALVVNPRVLLLDEPFGALDSETRQSMQVLWKRLAAERRITALFVTHDLREALIVGDQWAILEGGGLKLYPSRNAFIQDPASGVADEMQFWTNLSQP